MITKSVRSILLADDNLEYCFFFRKALKEVIPDVQLNEVHDGKKLMKLLERYLPDLLFLDLSMPCKNGMQCIKEIREARSYDLLPIVIISVNSKNHTIQTAYSLGANLYLVKPQEYSFLVSCLQEILSMDWTNPKNITKKYVLNDNYQPFMI